MAKIRPVWSHRVAQEGALYLHTWSQPFRRIFICFEMLTNRAHCVIKYNEVVQQLCKISMFEICCATFVIFKTLPKLNKNPTDKKFYQSGHPDYPLL
jgi:hypothetical protein